MPGASSYLPALLIVLFLPLKLAAGSSSKCDLPHSAEILLEWSSTKHLDGSFTVRVASSDKVLARLRKIEGKIVVVAVAGPHSERKSKILEAIVPHNPRSQPFAWEAELDEIRLAVVPP
jgi:hypothetical protein